MDCFPSITLLLLLVALTLPQQACGIEVTDEMIGNTPARVIRYRASEDSLEDATDTYIDVLNTEERWDTPLLPLQLGHNKPPRRWVPLDVEARNPEDKARLLTRDDNMYIGGFANATGHLFSFDTHEGSLEEAGATALSRGDSYRAFLEADAKESIVERLQRLPLGPDYYDEDVRTFSRFPYVSPEAYGNACARMAIVHCEAARNKKIRARIKEIWESGTEGYLDKKQVLYFMSWSRISLFLFCADRNIKMTGTDASQVRKLGIETIQDAKDTLSVIIRPVRWDPNNAEKSCSTNQKMN
ncbi:hypothetical protein EJB05_09951 [Eragrostis curvula]|uniref:rRNA N-glycosylase n=1 Tax=Eragrostis curvula TaxID=38414 RepID=A0A5J9W692_9POAL|nr:hypothetical protein EJB05_09951 [Eragrostis curvula]